MKNECESLKKTARLTGLLFLFFILTGIYGMMHLPQELSLKGGAGTVAQNILSKELLFRSAIINGLISSTLWIVIALLFYRLFKNVNEFGAKLLVAFVVVQIPVTFIMAAFNITALMLFKGELLTTFNMDQQQELGVLFLKINNYGTLALETFWGLWLLPLAYLVYRSLFIPRFIGVWLGINGLAYVVLSFTSLLNPEYGNWVYKLAFPAFFGEVAIMLWLLIKGVKLQSVKTAVA